MKYLTTVVTLAFLYQTVQLNGQCATPVTDAGLYCDLNAPEDAAPVICDLDCLDGFTASMPDTLLGDQPEFLCNGNGTPNNLSWFAFVAGSTTVDITITPSNCTELLDDNGDPIPQSKGIQAGVYKDCVFDTDNSIACFYTCNMNPNDPILPVNLVSNEYEIGQVYFLFVDGCGGSVCDYTVTVNAGEQAFEMEELNGVSNEYNYDFEVDTICQGAEIAFQLTDFDLNVNFNWSIDPPTSEYPSGIHPVTDTNTVDFIFSDEGTFNIYVYAYNECDESEPDTITVHVKALEDEFFSDVTICQECIIEGITLISPDAGCIISEGVPLILTEDPNNDGVPGWQGITEVMNSGLDSNVVTNVLGCEYKQYVDIVEIPLGAREQVNLYFCFSDFPVTFDGLIYSDPGDSKNITIENGAASGCDSLLRITALAIDLFGTTQVGNCENGNVSLSFNIVDVQPTDYDSIVYSWQNNLGEVILDDDDDDSMLMVNAAGTYSVMVSVYVDGTACSQSFGPFIVDPENLVPTTPTIAFAPENVCISEGQALIYVDGQGLGETFNWTITPGLPLTFGESTDTVFIDISGGMSFEFCVFAENGCGSSDMICDEVFVSANLDSEFEIDSEVCIDSILTVAYTGSNGQISSSEFTWDFDGGVVINGAELIGGGPFEISYATAGLYDISMTLFESGCESELNVQQVEVVDRLEPPTIECTELSGAVLFTFGTVDITSSSATIISGQNFEYLSEDSVLVSGLGNEDIVEVEILFNAEDPCGGVISSLSCQSLPCPQVGFEISLGNQNQCIDSEDRNIELAVDIMGDDSGQGQWISPFVYEDNLFNVLMAGPGAHDVFYNYDIGSCSYSIDTTIFLFESPKLKVELNSSYCEEEGPNLIDILVDDNTVVTVNNMIVNEFNDIPVESDILNVVAINEDNCMTSLVVENEQVRLMDLSIFGELEVLVGENNDYQINSEDLPNIQYNWLLNNEVLCVDCPEVTVSLNADALLCVEANFSESCSEMECIMVRAVEENEIYIPNIFSPNNDQINDRFSIQSNNPELLLESVQIYDRWGERVYEISGMMSNDQTSSWDGTYNNNSCAPGVYVYIINFRSLEGKQITKTGDITLVR